MPEAKTKFEMMTERDGTSATRKPVNQLSVAVPVHEEATEREREREREREGGNKALRGGDETGGGGGAEREACGLLERDEDGGVYPPPPLHLSSCFPPPWLSLHLPMRL